MMFRILKEILFSAKEAIGPEKRKQEKLEKSLQRNIQRLKQIFKHDDTVVFREVVNERLHPSSFVILFTEGMVNKQILSEHLLEPLMGASEKDHLSHKNFLDELTNKVMQSGHIKKSDTLEEVITAILYGEAVLLAEGMDEALIANTKGWQSRPITEPQSESMVRGPREGFTESMIVNISMLKRKIKSPDLKFRFIEIGERTKTRVCVSYLENIANEKIVQEVFRRLNEIKIDGILDSGYIEELIKDAPLSPWKTIGDTERPDVTAGKLLEGRIALICDGSPFVLTIPFIVIEYFQANEDYYGNYFFASFNRILRIFAFFLSTSVPAIYVALVTYHQEMIPTPLVISIAAAREGVPFPTIVQAFAMLIAFELLREAGVRLPRPIGQAISIVGALILGESAVRAQLVSAPMVIVTALTAISSFLVPKMMGELIITRFMLLTLAGVFGLYGYMFGVFGVMIHLMAIRSFGIPYMLNISSLNKQDLKDTAIRAPWWYMYYRPKLIGDKNAARKENTKMQERR
ncbi:spore germination protein [Geosporobacter ferrireducens]|nr:spore germination protein [Geosporobacter ferrireducens]